MDEHVDRNESAGMREPAGAREPAEPAESAGEAVCWVGWLCPECGAMPEGAGEHDPSVPCWRCGTIRSQVHGDGTPADGA